MAKLVSKTYSEALFEVALEENKVDLFLDEINFVNKTFKIHPELFEFFKTPLVKANEKKDVIKEIFGDKLSKEMNNFLKIIIDKRRGYAIKQIELEYEKLVNEHKGIVNAVAITAIPLKDKDKLILQNKLSTLTGKTVKLSNEIDNDVIGGILVKIGDKVIDGTIKSRLEKMTESLSQIIV
ncbi:F0F1 ATP synthase subunit delta [Paramaledivibacter caminithermalis]|jgi:F-type H+-transporting ATPase subunit delta|uniref:ATP synthase subunit delta n=1 Tax=Paramaledivibacter caminithermalis (strain DSM 15212 / CIP 107654 / DViRD3) TaxID=1121301 RepID=A0A1M6L3A7_PARC5|nr:F0F1 ATP synthase subunit delta [Paramaledivibacter caminithermalis]SHJ65677.1 ATP synthase F1 subcomplex delta subunit [Paramaledivibacter caminithermalis DSM 15212]